MGQFTIYVSAAQKKTPSIQYNDQPVPAVYLSDGCFFFFVHHLKNINMLEGEKMCSLLIGRWYKVTTVLWSFRECVVSSWI